MPTATEQALNIDFSQETNPDYPQEIWNQLRDNFYSPQINPTGFTGEVGIPGKDIPWSWENDSALREKVLFDKALQVGGRYGVNPWVNPIISGLNKINPWSDIPSVPIRSAFDPQVMSDLGVDSNEYDAMIHLIGGSTQALGSNIPGLGKSVMDIYEERASNPSEWETIKDKMNTLVGVDYQGTGATVKEMLDDPRTLITHEDAQDLEAAGLPSVDVTPTPEPDYNVQDQMAQWYERAFIDPTEYGVVAPTVEQRREAIRGVQDAPEGFWGALQSRIADLIPAAEASIAPIGEEGFSPTIDARTLDGPVVGSPDVPSGFEALASLIKDDPDVAKKYTTSPGQSTAALENLVANTGVETFTDIPDTPWTPPAPVVPDITQALADFSAIRDANEDRRNREQDERERELEQAADDRREAEQEARVEAARNKTAEKKRIAKENKERKAEEKRIADKQAAEEKERRAVEKQMADMLKRHNEAHQAYLDRKRKEEDRRKRQGYGVGGMWT